MCVQDVFRVDAFTEFHNDVSSNQFIHEIGDTLVRDRDRKIQKKVGESYHNSEFNTKLKSQGQCENFEEELRYMLNNIIESEGNHLTYFMCKNKTLAYELYLIHNKNIIDVVDMNSESFNMMLS